MSEPTIACYAELRELGPVVWLRSHETFALPGYAEVREALLTGSTSPTHRASR